MQSFEEIAIDFFKAIKGELDPSVSRKGTIEKTSPNSLSLYIADHIQFAKYGRAPGKQPPVNDILEFVKRKGIKFENTTQLGTAWAIAKGISKRGTIGYTPNAPNAMQESINNNLEEYFSKLSTSTLEEQTKEVNKIFENSFPKTITFKI